MSAAGAKQRVVRRKFVGNYFRRPWSWRFAHWIEQAGWLVIRLSVRVRNPRCHCKWCARDFEAIINGCEEHGMEIAELKDQRDELLLMCERKLQV